MKKLLNEYGLIAALLIVSVGGYLSLGEQKEDFLSDPLDAIGARFTDLMADDASKAEFSESYAQFRKKVMDKEITPEQFESVAASVLNLESSGEAISWEEATMVLSLASEPTYMVLPGPATVSASVPAVPASPAAPLPNKDLYTRLPVPSADATGRTFAASDVSPERYKIMNERMTDVFALADAMSDESKASSNLRSHVKFVMSDGISVVVDSNAVALWNEGGMRTLTRDIERKRMVQFKGSLEEYNQTREARFDAQRELYARSEANHLQSNIEKEYVMAIERLHKLESMGMVVEIDTVHLRKSMEHSIEMMMLELQAADVVIEINGDEESDAGEKVRIKVNSN
jgi:hypothetical protein